MRKDISFISKGLRCTGWLYIPDGLQAGQKAPAIVMANGVSAVKEMRLPYFADRFTDAGFVTMVFDYRNLGDSQGEPRCQVFPLEQVEDYRNAITWISEQPKVDSQRIGIWGSSLSGGLVLYIGTYDKRVKAVVAQVPSAGNYETRRNVNPQSFEATGKILLQDRIARYKTGAINYIKIVSAENEPCTMPGKVSYEACMKLSQEAPNWRNHITLESLEKIREFDPISLIHLIAPAALLLVAAENDGLIPLSAIQAVYQKANEPKSLSVLPITHFEIYYEPWLSKAVDEEIQWFKKYL